VSRPGRLQREPERARVDSLTHDGRGVAHVDGRVVFVPGALPGEEVRIERVRRRRGHDEARLLEVLEPSPSRVTPRCQYFGACGGCALQHLARDAQLEAKQSVLVENLRRIGHVEPDTVLPPLAGDAWHYRRRARLSVRRVAAKGRTLVGFRERAAVYVTDMRDCAVLAEPVAHLIGPLADLVDTLAIRERVPQIEVAVAGGETHLVMRVLEPPTMEDRERLRRFAAEHGVRWYLQPEGPQSARPLEEDTALPRYRLDRFDVEIEFAPTEFVQVNGGLNELLVDRALELLAPEATDEVLDLYCGVGNFTLPLARRAAHVTGVEGATELVERARANAARNGLANVSVHVADLNADVGDLPWARRRYDLLLLDPPRAGAAAVVEHVPQWQPRRIVYVSCDPATLARDAGRLVGTHGMRLVAAGIADMFPHTAHVEAVALFEPRRRGG
jgi:23S rRNA (uracil1939-C5)-methyltransferase